MSEKIQFIIEMPIPKYLEGNPYDEIEDEFRRYFLSATRDGFWDEINYITDRLEDYCNDLEEAEREELAQSLKINDNWHTVVKQTQVICSR